MAKSQWSFKTATELSVALAAKKVSAVELAQDAEHATVRVIDHGPGVPPEDATRIFERFQRAVSAMNYGGFGLGLWSVREIVRAHAGTVTVKLSRTVRTALRGRTTAARVVLVTRARGLDVTVRG